jgi:hypothetical protein
MTALGQTTFVASKVTRFVVVVVVSSMKKDSDQFFQSGLLQAYKYKELYPGHQVVFIIEPDFRSTNNVEVF